MARPSSIVLACGDGNAQVVDLNWSSWGPADARATGDYAVNDCNPNCVGGRIHTYPATITLGDVKTEGETRYFTTLTVQPEGQSPFDTPSRQFPVDTP